MEQGYKHFSHTHNLLIHDMPEGAEVSCSGCNSSATNTVYVCWQCNFFLHDQCFHASRSREHPSHPAHPLALVPYPTYPSNSFYCNSCKFIGTGFSYSCPDCEFDLHVQCAYSIATATNVTTTNNPHDLYYPNQEIVPHAHFHVPNSSMVPNIISSAPIPISANIPIPIPAHIPIPIPANIPIPVPAHIPIPVPAHIQIPVPAHIPIPIPVDNPIPIPIHAQYAQNVSTFPLPTSAQNAYTSQNFASIPTSAQNSYIPQSAPIQQPSHKVEAGQNRQKSQGTKHFTHPHGLLLVNLKHGKKEIACSGCEQTLVGIGYSCVEENCHFQLDESCFHMEREILHESHPPHPLALLSTHNKENGGRFTCNACFKDGRGFFYHCSICEYDVHVKCATLKETVKMNDHVHPLKLFYECPLKGEEYTFYCDVCNRVVPPGHWTYYCQECDYGTHLDCVDREECDETSGDDVVDA